MTMLYFAYGSNMLLEQITKRCLAAKFCGSATLPGYRLAFTRISTKQWPGYGVADVVPDPTGCVWGALFEIQNRDVPSLDKSEGYQPGRKSNAYQRISISVCRDADPARVVESETYIVCRRLEPNPLPHREYVGRIIAGAKWINAPTHYIEWLSKTPVRS